MVLRRLSKRCNGSAHMEHGQIKRAAKYTIKNLGHDWILSEDIDDKYIRMYLRLEVKRLVKTIVGTWHENGARVWLQFKNHCFEMAAETAARQVIKKITVLN